MAKNNHDIKLNLAENGLDFIWYSLTNVLADNDPTHLKYAIVHLAAGVELILKEVLRKEHWSLVFDDINTAKSESLEEGDFSTVNFKTLINRLKNICDVSLEDQEIKMLTDLSRDRNKIIHFEAKLNSFQVKVQSALVLNFILEFIEHHLFFFELSERSKAYLSDLNKKRLEFKEFVVIRMQKVGRDIKDNIVEICPACKQEALVLDGHPNSLSGLIANYGPYCHFCGYRDTPEKAAILYAEDVLLKSSHLCATDGEIFPVHECLYCDNESFINKGDEFVCFDCFEKGSMNDLAICSDCSHYYKMPDEDAFNKCEECLKQFFEKED